MKTVKKLLILVICLILMTGCSQNPHSGKQLNAGNSVDKVLSEQTSQSNVTEQTETSSEQTAASSSADDTSATETTENDVSSVEQSSTISSLPVTGTVDYDLTQMSTDMVYATVYQMMMDPATYDGKSFRIEGTFYSVHDDHTKKYYHYCIIQDATACCAQGMEFVWGDGSHVYPDEYPAEDADVIVEGTFETYREEGDSNLYCRLANATLETGNK